MGVNGMWIAVTLGLFYANCPMQKCFAAKPTFAIYGLNCFFKECKRNTENMKVSIKSISVIHACGCFLILIGLAISISETFALSLAVTPEYLTQKADLVILGRVKSRITEERPYISGTTNGMKVTYQNVEMVLTEYEVELEKSYKQEIGEPNISILTPGGFLPDGRGWTHSKYFELDVGERFIAFLVYDNRNKAWRVYAGTQGIFRAEENPTDSKTSIVTSAYGGHVVPRNDLPPHHRDPKAELKLQELLDIIRKESNR